MAKAQTAPATAFDEAEESPESSPMPPGNWGNPQEFADRVAEGVTRGMAAHMPRRKMSFGEFQASQPHIPRLTRRCFTNGFQELNDRMTAEEVQLWNRLNRSGRYLDRFVEVIVREDGSEQVVELRYPNGTMDQRMEVARRLHDMKTFLTQIVEEQDRLNAADEAKGKR